MESSPIPFERFEEYVLCDEGVDCYKVLDDDDIIQNVLWEKGNEEEVALSSDNGENNDDDSSNQIKNTTFKEAIRAIHTLHEFAESKGIGVEVLEELEAKLFKSELKYIQTKITEYFHA